MRITARQLAVRHAASKDATRYNLNGALIEPDGRTVATDGHMMITVSPALVGAEDVPSVPLAENTIMTLAGVEAMRVDARPKGKTAKAMGIDYAALDTSATNANGAVRYSRFSDDVGWTNESAGKIDGTFPAWRQVIKAEADLPAPAAVAVFNAELLERVCKAVKEFKADDGKGARPIRVEIRGELEPVRITATNNQGEEFLAVVMPMRA